jgi:hypothetical protein
MKRLLMGMIGLTVYTVIFQTAIQAQSHPNLLPNRTMLSFSGAKKQNSVELKGILSSSHSYNKMIIERTTPSAPFFLNIGEMDISGTATSNFAFTFLDTHPETGVNYYRIRLVSTTSNIQEISNTLMVKTDNSQQDMEVINTLVQSGKPMLSIRSRNDQEADLQFTDMSGRIVQNTKTKLNSGFNNISLLGLNTAKGYYILVVSTKNNTISRKIMVQ